MPGLKLRLNSQAASDGGHLAWGLQMPNNHITAGSLPSSELKILASVLPPVGLQVVSDENGDRTALVAEALWLFATRTGLDRDGEALETVLTDFLADMLHLCRQTGTEFSGITGTAEMHFEAEATD